MQKTTPNNTQKVIENGLVVTCDDRNRLGYYDLVVKNEHITEVVPHNPMMSLQHPNAEIIDAQGKLIVPGFIDAHYHGESFLIRHITANTPLEEWNSNYAINNTLKRIRTDLNNEELHQLYLIAYFAALRAGITTLFEFGFESSEDALTAISDAMKRADIKGILSLHNSEQIDFAHSLNSSTLKFSIALPSEHDLTTYNVHTNYSTARDAKYPLLAHIGETKPGWETIKKNFGKNFIKLLEDLNLLDNQLVLAHLTHFEKNELSLLLRNNIPYVFAPSSAIRKKCGLPPISTLYKKGIPIALSSDWGSIDPVTNINSFASLVQPDLDTQLNASDLLALHTRNGAKALGIENETGTIEVGKKADLTFLTISDFRFQPFIHSPNLELAVAELINELDNRSITDVMINGEFFIRQETILTIAEEDLTSISQTLIKKLFPKEINQPTPLPQHSELPLNIGNDWHSSLEEGFRIIKKNDTPETKKRTAKTISLPSTVKKVFGEDDTI